MHKILYLLIIPFTILLSGCDEGRIYNDLTKTDNKSDEHIVTVKFKASGISSWPTAYTVSVAVFEEGNDFALLSKSIGTSSDGNNLYEITLTNIPAEASVIEVCVVDRLRRRVATFFSQPLSNQDSDEIYSGEEIDFSMFSTIQNNIFSTTCANCHGKSTNAAAGLYLTEGKSYENLVNKPSTIEGNDVMRVLPGSRDKSLLYMILAGSASENWQYDHSVEIVDDVKLELIGAWIDSEPTE